MAFNDDPAPCRRSFTVQDTPDASNLAYTREGLPLHTDNPYRDPCPGIQLLHCQTPAPVGGDSVLVDGIAVAERLRDEARTRVPTWCTDALTLASLLALQLTGPPPHVHVHA